MDITEFEQNLNEKVLPLIKEQMMLAYTNGYKEAEKEREEMTIAEYKKKHNIDRVIDLSLPSKTIWYKKLLSFDDISKSDIKLPTDEQIDELIKCKWYKCYGKICLMGLDGIRNVICDPSEEICFWYQNSELFDFNLWGKVYDVERGEFIYKKVFSGEKFWTLLVLPNNLKKDI